QMTLGQFTVTVNLENIAREFARDRDEAVIAHFVEQLSDMASPNIPDWPEAEIGLRLKAETADYQFGEAIREKVSDSLYRVLTYVNPDGSQILWIMPWMLQRWGKSQEEAEEV